MRLSSLSQVAAMLVGVNIIVSLALSQPLPETTPVSSLNINAEIDDIYTHDDWTPEIFSDGYGTWIALYLARGITNLDIAIRRSTGNANTWGPEIVIAVNQNSISGIDFATDGNGNWVVVWGEWIGDKIWFARSNDNGTSWSNPAVLITNPDFTNFRYKTPEIEYDGQGNWIVAWYLLNRGNSIPWGFRLIRSTDTGATWSSPVSLVPDDGYFSGFVRLRSNGYGTSILYWQHSGQTIFSRSTNGGVSWSNPAVFSPNGVGPSLTSDGSNNWVAVGLYGDTTVVIRSVDDGMTWLNQETVPNFNFSPAYGGQIVTDRQGSWIYQRDNQFSLSIDAGATWSETDTLIPDAVDARGSMIAFDGKVNWMVVWSSDKELSGTTGPDKDIFYSIFRYDCNVNLTPDLRDINDSGSWDLNSNLIPDECDALNYVPIVDKLTGNGINFFQKNRSAQTYHNMIAAYGRPWRPDTCQNPSESEYDDPASHLRALAPFVAGPDFQTVLGPIVDELFAFEMLLGNEAYSDAMDPTIGSHGIAAADLGGKYSFEGTPGIYSLLGEELALLRGLEIPGMTDGCLNDDAYYPEYSDPDTSANYRAAIYNRLPPNAEGGISSLAYISNYGEDINNNFDAVMKYPQGHGDAYGYYLTAMKVYLDLFRGGPGVTTVSMDFNTLPSAQGWTYSGANGTLEDEIFSVEGNKLTMNVEGAFWRSGHYYLDDVIDPHLPFTTIVEAKLIRNESHPIYPYHGAFGFSGHTGTERFGISIAEGLIQDSFGNVIVQDVDTKQKHTYSLQSIPDAGYDLYVDDVHKFAGLPHVFDDDNRLFIGDGASSANAHVEISRYRFYQVNGDEHASSFARMFIETQNSDNEPTVQENGNVVSVPYRAVRNMAKAMAARARTSNQIVNLTFRRDYREDPGDPFHEQTLEDFDRERAWGTADWARRAGQGAYLDWAVLNQLMPPSPECLDDLCVGGAYSGQECQSNSDCASDTLGEAHRGSVDEIGELAAAVGEMQERVDTAGAGLNPLGLVQNVVPFGIDAAILGPGKGLSHYEQVREAAVEMLNNTRSILSWANDQSRRMREQDEAQATFGRQVEDREADFRNRLIETFGYPSADDPVDNDFQDNDGDGEHTPFDDGIEAAQSPDLVNFLLDEDAIKERSWSLREAPGEIQMAMSELRIAELQADSASESLGALEAEIDDLLRFITFRSNVAREEIRIINLANEQEIKLINRLKEMAKLTEGKKKRRRWRALSALVAGGIQGFFGGAGGEGLDSWGGWIGAATGVLSGIVAHSGPGQSLGSYDIQRERARVNGWRDAELTKIRNEVEIKLQWLRLRALIRQTPQLLVNIDIAEETATQALNRLNSAMQRGHRLLQERERIRKVQRDQLQQYRWKDLAFRVFRNNALQQYHAFFDLSARYVTLASRAYAYEFNDRTYGDDVLEKIHRQRRLGKSDGTSGGLQGIIFDLDNLKGSSTFNEPLDSVGQRTFSLRTNLLGLEHSLEDDLAFRATLESNIVQRLQDMPIIQDYVQLSEAQHYGPAIVVPFFTEAAGNNFFGNGPEPPFGNTNFPISLNVKIRNIAVRFDGVNPGPLGIDPVGGFVSAFVFPVGASVLRESTNAPTLEEEPPRPWAVVDQWLPVPPLVSISDVEDRNYNPWVSTAHSGGNYLNAIKRFRELETQVELGQPIEWETQLAGRSAWNTQWYLIIPGGQWSSSSNTNEIRSKLMKFIYGENGNPGDNTGITDIRLIIQAYAN